MTDGPPRYDRYHQRLRRVQRVYGLTAEDYELMRLAQSDRCSICRAKLPLVVDHDHATGRVRELLCGQHNTGLGLFGDSPELLRRAADYLERHRAAEPASASAALATTET